MKHILPLTIKKEWFNMIVSGEKKEEYREIKNYWISRLFFSAFTLEKSLYHTFEIKSRFYNLLPFKFIKFVNGYNSNAPTCIVEFEGLEIREGRKEWGAEPGKKYFVLKLGKIITIKK